MSRVRIPSPAPLAPHPNAARPALFAGPRASPALRPSGPVGRLAWSQLDKCGRELSVGTERRIGRLLGADLDANLICARGEVVADAFGDRVDVAPGDDRVDQAIGAVAGDVGFGRA